MMSSFLPIQIILIIFLAFAVSRVFLRLRDGSLTLGAFLFWTGLWILGGLAVVKPSFTSFIAREIGIQRGTDVVIYLSLSLLFYLVFRTNILLEDLRNEITKLARKIALKNKQKEKK